MKHIIQIHFVGNTLQWALPKCKFIPLNPLWQWILPCTMNLFSSFWKQSFKLFLKIETLKIDKCSCCIVFERHTSKIIIYWCKVKNLQQVHAGSKIVVGRASNFLYEKNISAQLPVNIYLVVVPSCYIFINSYTEGYSMWG